MRVRGESQWEVVGGGWWVGRREEFGVTARRPRLPFARSSAKNYLRPGAKRVAPFDQRFLQHWPLL